MKKLLFICLMLISGFANANPFSTRIEKEDFTVFEKIAETSGGLIVDIIPDGNFYIVKVYYPPHEKETRN